MESNNDLLLRINERYASLSKGQKRIAQFITNNYDKSAFLTAAKLGALVGTSESTIVRFAYALGCDGYPELQRSLRELARNRLTNAQRMELNGQLDTRDILMNTLKADMGNIRSTIENIDPEAFENAVNAMLKARTVYVLGLRSSTSLAQFLGYYLGFVLYDVRIVSGFSDVYEQLVRISPDDLCFGISFPRYSTRTVDALAMAKGQGAHVVALTDCDVSPLARWADDCLLARSDMASFADSLVAPLAVINALIAALGAKRKDEVQDRFDRLEGMWNMQGVYVNSED